MSDSIQSSVTLVRRLTAAVSSAIAVIAVDGPQAAELVSAALNDSLGRPVHLDRPGARFAHWRFADSRLADEHVVVLVRSPWAIEIHCHGGLAITGRIMEQLQAAGCEMLGHEAAIQMRVPAIESVPAPDSVDVHVTDAAIEAAARLALQSASTLKASLVWLEQYQGALARDFATLNQLVAESRRLEGVELCDTLLTRARFGMKLLQPWRLTLAGPPNVGKSSLMNALCGATRVLVHHEPGTTRDAIQTNLVIGDWPVMLTDTAGIRDTSESIERLGIETAWQRWRMADLGLLVVDATVGWTSQHDAMLVGPELIVVVLNKVDAITDQRQLEQAMTAINERLPSASGLAVMASARLERGIDNIVHTIGAYLDSCRPACGSGIPFTCTQIKWIEQQKSRLAVADMV